MNPSHVLPEWKLAKPDPCKVRELITHLDIHPLLAKCLVNRGLDEVEKARRFLVPRLKDLSDPFEMDGMKDAVERLMKALVEGEKILIFGDYDVDGVSSASMLMSFFSDQGWDVDYFLPNRFSEGYGLTIEAIQNCLDLRAFSLLLAVDCGTTATETVRHLNQKGIDVIILDHHLPGEDLPQAVALVNPKARCPKNPGPGGVLCTAGLAFKLMHGLVKQGRINQLEAFESCDIRPYLDLVALGTISDLVPLHAENRILVHAGLKCLSTTTRPGLIALKRVAGLSGELDAGAAAFQLGPRLNAAGRLEDASQSFDLLLTDSAVDSDRIAKALDQHNKYRQQVEAGIFEEVVSRLQSSFDPEKDWCIVEAHPGWHPGVVGIIAARIMRMYYRPTIILGGEREALKGSGRSIRGFDLADAMAQMHSCLLSHGGHASAAGLTLAMSQLPTFREGMNRIVKAQFNGIQPQPALDLDDELDFEDLRLQVMRGLEALAPFGQENPRVKLLIRSVLISNSIRIFGKSDNHLTFQIQLDTMLFQVIWWNYNPDRIPIGTCDLAVEVGLETFRGVEKVRLYLLDWRPAR